MNFRVDLSRLMNANLNFETPSGILMNAKKKGCISFELVVAVLGVEDLAVSSGVVL